MKESTPIENYDFEGVCSVYSLPICEKANEMETF